MREKGSAKLRLRLLSLFLVLLCISELFHGPSHYLFVSAEEFLPEVSPEGAPQPFLPFIAPSPMTPFTNITAPKLSGECPLNFTVSDSENIMSVTSTDCLASFAPYLANVVCCPQLDATLVILIGQSSKNTGMLALNDTTARHCLSDVEQVLVSQGADNNLQHLCEIHPSNLTEGSCPVKDVSEFEDTVNSSKLLAACQKIDLVNECCKQVCQNAILDAAQSMASKADLTSGPQLSATVEDCRHIALRWLASSLDASSAKELLRGLSNCNTNKVCPLALPDARNVTKECRDEMSNPTACCNSMKTYVTRLQNQSFTTNLQALNCAALLGMKLRKDNVTRNLYNLCHISLKDFSVQAGTQESGCLLQSLPSDVTLDQSSGITFMCDLNDNIAAPWPSAYQLPDSSCNKTVNIPALPAAASGQSGLLVELWYYLLLGLLSALMLLN